VILDRTIVTAGFVAEGAGDPALAEPKNTRSKLLFNIRIIRAPVNA